MDMLISKLGKNKGVERSRIWVEGSRLSAHGFHRGTYYVREWAKDEGALYLSIPSDDDVLSSKPLKVAGKGDHPIIDTTGASVQAFFAGYTHVRVEFQTGIIRITAHAQD